MWLYRKFERRKLFWKRFKSSPPVSNADGLVTKETQNGNTNKMPSSVPSCTSGSTKSTVSQDETCSTGRSRESSMDDWSDCFPGSPRLSSESVELATPSHLPSTDSPAAKKKKKVSFASKMMVILIPTKEELRSLSRDLHYSSTECDRFRYECYKELMAFKDTRECFCKRNYLLQNGLLMPTDDQMIQLTVTSEKDSHIKNSDNDIDNDSDSDRVINLELDAHNFDSLDMESHTLSHALIHCFMQLLLNQPCTIKDASTVLYQPWSQFETESETIFNWKLY